MIYFQTSESYIIKIEPNGVQADHEEQFDEKMFL